MADNYWRIKDISNKICENSPTIKISREIQKVTALDSKAQQKVIMYILWCFPFHYTSPIKIIKGVTQEKVP